MPDEKEMAGPVAVCLGAAGVGGGGGGASSHENTGVLPKRKGFRSLKNNRAICMGLWYTDRRNIFPGSAITPDLLRLNGVRDEGCAYEEG